MHCTTQLAFVCLLQLTEVVLCFESLIVSNDSHFRAFIMVAEAMSDAADSIALVDTRSRMSRLLLGVSDFSGSLWIMWLYSCLVSEDGRNPRET